MSDISELLEKVKAAAGPDRELDVVLHAVVLDDREIIERETWILGRNRKPPHDECVLGRIDPGKHQRNFSPAYHSPAQPEYTASIDAALALVERKLPEAQVGLDPIFFVGYAVGSESVEWDAIICIPHWDRWNPVNSEWIERIEARHKDKRLAILAALLSALEATP